MMLDFTKAIEVNPKEAIYFNNKGLVFENFNHFDSAIVYYDKAIDLNSTMAFCYYNKSVSQFALNDTIGAMETINIAVELSPSDEIILFNRGILNLQMKRMEQACSDWQKSNSLGNNEALSYISKYCDITIEI